MINSMTAVPTFAGSQNAQKTSLPRAALLALPFVAIGLLGTGGQAKAESCTWVSDGYGGQDGLCLDYFGAHRVHRDPPVVIRVPDNCTCVAERPLIEERPPVIVIDPYRYHHHRGYWGDE
jgi:hypothetical protein